MTDLKGSIRAQKSAATKERIYRAGVELLRQYGYDGVTIEMITKAAGVSVGSFYHFFGSKENLLSKMSERVNSQFSIPDDINYEHDNCKERLLEFYKKQSAFLSGLEPDYMNSIFFGSRGNKTLLLDNRTYRKLMKEMLTGFKNAGQIKADLDINIAEETLMIAYFGAIYFWATNGYSGHLYETIRQVLNGILDSFLQ